MRSALLCLCALACSHGSGNNPEPALPPEPAVIDTHTHFYDPSRPVPPGRDRPIQWPSSGSLYRTVLPSEYGKWARPLGITGTVVVEASGWLEDNDWILALAAEESIIVGFVGNFGEVWKDPAKFDEALARYRRNPLFRGLRVGNGQVGPAVNMSLHLDNFRKLAEADLMADVLNVGWNDIDKLAQQVPDLRIVINHMGPGFRARTPADTAWAAGVELAARHPNVFLKVSSLTDGAAVSASIDVAWNAFGEDRLIFGSNWPVADPLQAAHEAVRAYFSGKGTSAEEKVFAANARRVYKWVRR